MRLVIGNKRYSSWSLRPWLALSQAGIHFEETVLFMDRPEFKEQVRQWSPTGKVPVLIDGNLVIWESLAICEYVAERFPDKGLWPADPAARALARSAASEMHSGFVALRRNMSMDVVVSKPGQGRAEGVDQDIARIVALWRELRERAVTQGPFLLGHFTIADAMFAPVCTRFRTYAVELPDDAALYVDTILSLPAMQAWTAAARLEP